MRFEYIAIHHTAVSREKQKVQLWAVNRYHQEKDWDSGEDCWYQGEPSSLGWWVGYNYFIEVDGTLTQCRMEGEETIAQTGHNCDVPERCDTISICLAGDFNIELPNQKQVKTLRRFINDMPYSEVVFHRDLQANRTCPGKLFTKEYLRHIQDEYENPDEEDKKKQERMAEQQSVIDWIRQILHKMVVQITSLRV